MSVRFGITFRIKEDDGSETVTEMYLDRVPQLGESVMMNDTYIRCKVVDVLNAIDTEFVDRKAELPIHCNVNYTVILEWDE